ncbi:conserved hypothetical protein [Echinococcus multilocularis]|uniref:DUF5745 domain-containing protein n=1 Tax=Echinococcus multilocularis TaxID=6211 RepID=A0A068XYI4_ECHMU|nr:conserved hypothetical protein [Echinococcus multilocularis]
MYISATITACSLERHFQIHAIMPPELSPAQVLELSNCIKNKVGIKRSISSFNDIGIEFFEEIFSYISPNYVVTSNQPACKRFQYILQWLSDYLDTSLDHINADSLVLCDPLNLHNLLEILNLCVDAEKESDVYKSSENIPQSKQEMDAALEQSRLKYLSCKLAEMFLPETAETLPPPIELEPGTPPKTSNTSGPRVKFVDMPHVVTPYSADPPQSSGSILRVVERPLRQGLRCRYPQTLYANMKPYLRWWHSMPSCKVPSQDVSALLQELLKKLDQLELSRETQNYIKLKLQSIVDTTRAVAPSHRRAQGEWRLEEVANRQRRRIELMEHQAVDAERMLSLRDSQAFQRLLLNELRQRRRQEVLDRHFCLRHDERLHALAAARKAQEEQIIKRTFDAALEKARQSRIERNNLRREVRKKEIELQNLLISNLENWQEERILFLQDEQNKRQAEMDLQAKSNKVDNLREKIELRHQLTRRIKDLEEALLNQLKPRDLRECDEICGN